MEKISEYLSTVKDGSFVEKLDHRIATPLFLLGTALLSARLLRPVSFIYRHFLRPRKNLLKRYGGGWAVVTGASSGIGFAYCKELVKIGFKVAMVARNPKKLADRAAELA